MKFISVETLNLKIQNNEVFQILDLRDSRNFQKSSIVGSINKPLLTLNPLNIKRHFSNRFLSADLIVLVSQSERKSSQAFKLLESYGMNNLAILKGGYEGWVCYNRGAPNQKLNSSQSTIEREESSRATTEVKTLVEPNLKTLYLENTILILLLISNLLGLFLDSRGAILSVLLSLFLIILRFKQSLRMLCNWIYYK
jgi:rhodanese-related sulfurtransferase